MTSKFKTIFAAIFLIATSAQAQVVSSAGLGGGGVVPGYNNFTPSRVLVTDANGKPITSNVTPSQLGNFVSKSGDTMTGVLGVVAGTNALPGLTFSGDTDTGLFSPGANQASVTAGGTEMLRANASGSTAVIRAFRALQESFSTTLPSAATVDLGTATGNIVPVSGTTTITSLGSSAGTGASYRMRFTGALTLTNSANLILPTGANITTATGDTAWATYEGSSVWRVYFYQRANGQALAGGGGGGGPTLQTNGTPNGSQSLLNLAAGSGVTLTDNGTGTVTVASSGAGGTPGGATTQVQYNTSGAFAADGNFTRDAANNYATIVTATDGTITDNLVLRGDGFAQLSSQNGPDNSSLSLTNSTADLVGSAAVTLTSPQIENRSLLFIAGDYAGDVNNSVLTLNDSLKSLVFSVAGQTMISGEANTFTAQLGNTDHAHVRVDETDDLRLITNARHMDIENQDTFDVRVNNVSMLLLDQADKTSFMGDYNVSGNGTWLGADDNNKVVLLEAPLGQINQNSPIINAGDVNNTGNGNIIVLDDSVNKIQVGGNTSDVILGDIHNTSSNKSVLDLNNSSGTASLTAVNHIDIDSKGSSINIGDAGGAFNQTSVVIDDATSKLSLNAPNGAITFNSGNFPNLKSGLSYSAYDANSSDQATYLTYEATYGGSLSIGDMNGHYEAAGGGVFITFHQDENSFTVNHFDGNGDNFIGTNLGPSSGYFYANNGGTTGRWLSYGSIGTDRTAAMGDIDGGFNGNTVTVDDNAQSVTFNTNNMIYSRKVVTPTGTTGDQTIDKAVGSVNFAIGGDHVTITDNLVTTGSVILCTVASTDLSMNGCTVNAGSGSFDIIANSPPTAETRVNFFLIN